MNADRESAWLREREREREVYEKNNEQWQEDVVGFVVRARFFNEIKWLANNINGEYKLIRWRKRSGVWMKRTKETGFKMMNFMNTIKWLLRSLYYEHVQYIHCHHICVYAARRITICDSVNWNLKPFNIALCVSMELE